MYNETFMENLTSNYQYVAGVNTESGQLLFLMIMVVLWIVLFAIVTYKFDFQKGLGFSSFVCTMLSILLWRAELLAGDFVIPFMFLTFIGVFLMIYDIGG
jgi:hypothetical protein